MAETYRRNIAAAEEEIAGLQTALEELAGRGAAFRQRLAAITEEKNALEAERTAKNRAGQEMNENAAEPGAGGGQAGPEAGHLRHGGKADPGPAVGDTTNSPTPTPRHSGSSWRACPRPTGGSGS